MSQSLLFINPEEPDKSFLHRYGQDNHGLKEWTIESVVQEIEKEKRCFLEFTDFFGRQVPKGSTEEYFRALQPFYVTKMTPKLSTFDAPFRKNIRKLRLEFARNKDFRRQQRF